MQKFIWNHSVSDETACNYWIVWEFSLFGNLFWFVYSSFRIPLPYQVLPQSTLPQLGSQFSFLGAPVPFFWRWKHCWSNKLFKNHHQWLLFHSSIGTDLSKTSSHGWWYCMESKNWICESWKTNWCLGITWCWFFTWYFEQ